jgi:hypothetical protein
MKGDAVDLCISWDFGRGESSGDIIVERNYKLFSGTSFKDISRGAYDNHIDAEINALAGSYWHIVKNLPEKYFQQPKETPNFREGQRETMIQIISPIKKSTMTNIPTEITQTQNDQIINTLPSVYKLRESLIKQALHDHPAYTREDAEAEVSGVE